LKAKATGTTPTDQRAEEPEPEPESRKRAASTDIETDGNGQTLEEQAAAFAKDALATDTSHKAAVDLIDLAPRKPNWDLKRDLDIKLAKLERRTDLAIAMIIRERLRESGNAEDAEKVLEGVDKMEQAAEEDD
jgi:coiled-coil domain-containing protein 12